MSIYARWQRKFRKQKCKVFTREELEKIAKDYGCEKVSDLHVDKKPRKKKGDIDGSQEKENQEEVK